MAPWKARKVAQATHGLSQAAAAYVDAELADRLDSCGAVLIERVVAQAIAKFHPELLRQRAGTGAKLVVLRGDEDLSGVLDVRKATFEGYR